ncbi:PLP-dependent aminotransferase family protein [Desulfurococcaceae archaeon MEX13E-LK6-19]|nr:PLP-dependent aminotransferase family protein [Desulfurococcaceae archaeon MEX13E-LK6-19]
MELARPDFYKFFASRVNYMNPSPIREAVSKIAIKSRTTQVISFAAGEPDPDVLPRDLYAKLSSEIFLKVRKIVNYSPSEGIIELREEIAKFMKEYESVDTSMDRIVVTIGGSQALDIVARIMLEPGDIVVTENPSYVNTLLCWSHYGVKIVGVPMDDNGMITEKLEETLKKLKETGRKVKLVYTIPTGQNPSGITMSMDRRKHLLEIASKYDVLVVEDTAYNHLVYEPIDVKPLRSLDKEDRVIYAGSFSKVLGTGLRIGWLEAPQEIIEKIRYSKQPMDMCAPVPSQYLVTEVLKRGLFPEIKKKAIEAYKKKRDIMLEMLDKYLPGLKHTKPVAGMFILLWLPEKLDAWEFADKLLDKYNVAVIPATPFFTDGSGKNVIRMNFSMANPELIEEGVSRIAKLVKELTQ